jgi:hypothetical protein
MSVYYHFTCHHAAKLIGRHGVLRPPEQRHPLYPDFPRVIWLTDMPRVREEDRESLGLTSNEIACDRTKFRYIVQGTEADKVQAWLSSKARAEMRSQLIDIVECYGLPARWFISEQPLRAHRL